MSNVALIIGGRSFTVACAEGEEEHIAELGQMIESKLAAMGDMTSQSESRMLLFAALLLADELHDARANEGAADASPPPAAPVSPAGVADDIPDNLAERLGDIAARLENLAARLEG